MLARKIMLLLSDSTWETCQSGIDVMEGYMIMGDEVQKQLLSRNCVV